MGLEPTLLPGFLPKFNATSSTSAEAHLKQILSVGAEAFCPGCFARALSSVCNTIWPKLEVNAGQSKNGKVQIGGFCRVRSTDFEVALDLSTQQYAFA
jgi:hypothetical protein